MHTEITHPIHIKRSFFKGSSKSSIYIVLLCVVILLLSTKGIMDEGTVSLQGDMPRYLMNGVYFYDFFRDLPLAHPLKYTYEYFARYPALSLGHHPILLSIAEAPFFAVFGISVFSGRLTIIFFMLLAGIAWFLLVKTIYTEEIAFFSSLLFITTPFVVQFSRSVMSEIPGLACIIIMAYFFYGYVHTDKAKYLYGFAIMLFFSILARYQAIFMVPVFLAYFLIVRGVREFFTPKKLLTVLLLVIFLCPLFFIMLKYSHTNVSWLLGKSLASRVEWSNLSFHLYALWKSQLTAPVFILSVFSLVVSLYRRDRRALLFLVWIVGYYLQITCVGAKGARYSIAWIPPFCLLAAATVDCFPSRAWKIPLSVLLAMVAGYQFSMAFQLQPDYAAGYERAAKYVVAHPKGETMLFSPNVDSGYFAFFTRKHDPRREKVVLRADKLLITSFLWWVAEERITSREQIYPILQKFGVGYVIIEDLKYPSPPMEWLREEVKTDRFILRQSIPIHSNNARLRDVAIHIYEYKEYTPPQRNAVLRMNIPLLGNSIEVTLDELFHEDDRLRPQAGTISRE